MARFRWRLRPGPAPGTPGEFRALRQRKGRKGQTTKRRKGQRGKGASGSPASPSGVVTTATNGGGIIGIGARNANASINFGTGATAAVGTTTVNALSPTNAFMLVTPGTQGWTANVAGGSGTLTIATLTGASGTFNFVLVPTPGSGATGTKTITDGQFAITL